MFNPWVRKIPWGRKWQPTPVFLPGKSHGRRILAGSSPWGSKRHDRVTIQQQQYIVFTEMSIEIMAHFVAGLSSWLSYKYSHYSG